MSPVIARAGRAVALGLVALTLVACGAARRRDTDLNEVLRRFHEAVRWQNFEAASAFVPALAREAWYEEKQARAATRRVTDYNIRRVRQDNPYANAVVVIETSWYDVTDPTVRHEVRYQQWRFEENRWWMVAETAEDPGQKGMGSSSNPPPAGGPPDPPPPGPGSPQPPPPP